VEESPALQFCIFYQFRPSTIVELSFASEKGKVALFVSNGMEWNKINNGK